MKHSFTDQQLADAYEAALKEGPCGGTPADYMRAVVNHLPEPAPDDWQECDYDELHPTDKRVKAVLNDSDTVIEGKPVGLFQNGHILLLEGGVNLHADQQATFYRIPAPVQRPDPEVNHFIRINGKDYEAIPDSGRYQLIESKWSSPMVLNVEHITEWEELELIPKVVEDDR